MSDKIECPWCYGEGEVGEGLEEPISNRWYQKLEQLHEENEALKVRVSKLEYALRWYANGGNWWPNGHLQIDQDIIPALLDKGQRALRALRND